MVINEITWRIVPPSLEGAGFFEIRQRAEVEVRRLLLEIKRLEADNALLRLKLDGPDGDPYDPNAMSYHSPEPSSATLSRLREVLVAIDNTAVLIANGKTLGVPKEYSIPGEVLKLVEEAIKTTG